MRRCIAPRVWTISVLFFLTRCFQVEQQRPEFLSIRNTYLETLLDMVSI